MKKIIMLVALALIGVAAWYFWETAPKPDTEITKIDPAPVSSHSAEFNQKAGAAMQAYYSLSDALVAWDTAKVAAQTTALQQQLQQFPLIDLQQDSTAYQSAIPLLKKVQEDADAMAKAANLEARRRQFHSLSKDMYSLLRTVHYDAQKVYLQECPMAFNDEEVGNWLSAASEIRNPYLGTQHPKYKSGMLECGETKDSIALAGTK